MGTRVLNDQCQLYSNQFDDGDLQHPSLYDENLKHLFQRQTLFVKSALWSTFANIALSSGLFYLLQNYVISICSAGLILAFTVMMIYYTSLCDTFIIENKRLLNRSSIILNRLEEARVFAAQRASNTGPIAFKKALPRFEEF